MDIQCVILNYQHMCAANEKWVSKVTSHHRMAAILEYHIILLLVLHFDRLLQTRALPSQQALEALEGKDLLPHSRDLHRA